MAIIIGQGKQDTSQDGKFKPIVAKNQLLEVQELKLSDKPERPNTLECTFRILEGEFKNKFVFDNVSFDPTSNFSWKYRSLRAACGVPYNENEPASIDIEELLLHKIFPADLSIRKGKNKYNEDTDYQKITYIEPKAATAGETPAVIVKGADVAIEFEDVEDKPAPEQVIVESPAVIEIEQEEKMEEVQPEPVVEKTKPEPVKEPEPIKQPKPEVKKPEVTDAKPVIKEDDEW